MALIERRFLDVRLVVNGVTDDVPNGIEPYKGLQYIVGDNPSGAFDGASTNDIAIYDGAMWKFQRPHEKSLEFYDISSNSFKRWNGTEFSQVASFNNGEFYVTHTVTESEAAQKYFEFAPEFDVSGVEVRLVIGGMTHIRDLDYTVISGNGVNKLSWAGLGLDVVGVLEGDIFLIILSNVSDIPDIKSGKVEVTEPLTDGLGEPESRMPYTDRATLLIPDWGLYYWDAESTDTPDGETCVLNAAGDAVGRWKIAMGGMDFYYNLKEDLVDEIRSYALSGSATITWPSMAAYGGTATGNIPIEGVCVGDVVTVYSPSMLDKLTYMGYVEAPNVVTVRAVNTSNAAITPAASVWYAYVHRNVI